MQDSAAPSERTLHAQPSTTPQGEHIDGLALRSLDDIRSHASDDVVDPRLLAEARPSQERLDEGLVRQFSDIVHHKDHAHHHHHSHQKESTGDVEKGTNEKTEGSEEEEVIYVTFEENDPRDPINFPKWLKWAITITASMFTLLASANGATYTLGFDTMTADLNCTTFQATIGVAMYCLGFGIVPLFSASFSEEFGRRPLYVVSSVGFMLMHIMAALSQNVSTVIVARFLSGAFGSTGSTMVGGSIADIWRPYERGTPMSIFTLTAISGVAVGPVAAGWIDMDPRLGWRWIQWIHAIAAGILCFGIWIFMKETRGSIILTRLAKKTRKETGDIRYRARAEDETASLKTLIWISSTRPFYLLISEPIVAACSLWIGFAWGILYCMIESIGSVFRDLHGFNTGEMGTAFLAVLVGVIFGFASTIHQERVYQKYVKTRGSEARLYWACAAGILFPVGMFIYAWTTFPYVPWIALCIGIAIVIWAIYIMYMAVFVYLADIYGPFASSSLAGQSLCRNLMGMAFPLFTNQMFAAMTYKWANTLFGCLAALMAPIPFILLFYGPKIREYSKFARQAMHN